MNDYTKDKIIAKLNENVDLTKCKIDSINLTFNFIILRKATYKGVKWSRGMYFNKDGKFCDTVSDIKFRADENKFYVGTENEEFPIERCSPLESPSYIEKLRQKFYKDNLENKEFVTCDEDCDLIDKIFNWVDKNIK